MAPFVPGADVVLFLEQDAVEEGVQSAGFWTTKLSEVDIPHQLGDPSERRVARGIRPKERIEGHPAVPMPEPPVRSVVGDGVPR